jgi:CubicO group peptidase (beta-lactamase class C family)
MAWAEVEKALAEAIDQRVVPGAVLIARRGDEVVYQGAFGHRTLTPEPQPLKLETVFDLSSLTKPLATATVVMMLVREGKLRLDDRVTRFFHNFGVHGKGAVTFRQLLAHCSGLAAWRPFYQQVMEIEKGGKVNFMASHGAKEFVYEQIHREKLDAPPGTKVIYSAKPSSELPARA